MTSLNLSPDSFSTSSNDFNSSAISPTFFLFSAAASFLPSRMNCPISLDNLFLILRSSDALVIAALYCLSNSNASSTKGSL